MTELAKVINNQTDNIDFGKLIEEAKASLEGFVNFIEKNSSDVLNKIPSSFALLPGTNTVFVVNAILNYIGIPDSLLPVIAAGISILEQTYTANIPESGKDAYHSAKILLEKSFTAVMYNANKK